MSSRERVKRILENAGIDYVSNSTVEDILEAAGSVRYDNSYELEQIRDRLEKIEKQLGIEDND